MTFVAAAVGIGGALIGASSSRKAAKAQQKAAEQAAALERETRDLTRADQAPFRRRGDQAGNRLQYLMGLDSSVGAPVAGGGAGGPTFSGGMVEVPTTFVSGQTDDPLWERLLGDFNARHSAQFGSPMNRGWSSDADAQREYQALSKQYRDAKAAEFAASQAQAAASGQAPVTGEGDPQFGSLMRRMTRADIEADPVYQSGLQFGLDEGAKAINNRAGAGGSFLSGATLKALTRFGSDYGTTKAAGAYDRFTGDQTSQYNRLAGIAGTGQTAANQLGSANNAYAARAGDYLTQGGNAAAAGAIGRGNALTSGINTAYNMYQDQNLMNQIRNPSGQRINPNSGEYMGSLEF